MKKIGLILSALCLLPFFLHAQLGGISTKRISLASGVSMNQSILPSSQNDPLPYGWGYQHYCGFGEGFNILPADRVSLHAYPTYSYRSRPTFSLRLAGTLIAEQFPKWELDLGLMADLQRRQSHYADLIDYANRAYIPTSSLANCRDFGQFQTTRAIGLDVSLLRILSFWNRFEAYGGLGTMTSFEWTEGFIRTDLPLDPVYPHQAYSMGRLHSQDLRQQVFLRAGLRVAVWSGLEVGVDGRLGSKFGRSMGASGSGVLTGLATVSWTFDQAEEY